MRFRSCSEGTNDKFRFRTIRTSGQQQQRKPREAAVKYYPYRTFIILGPTKGMSKGTPDDAKCVTEILGDKNKEVGRKI